MSSVVIVTDECYLLAEAINYIVINEVDDSNDSEWVPRKRNLRRKRLPARTQNRVQREYMKERKPYNITISFIPKNPPSASSAQSTSSRQRSVDDNTFVSLRIHGYDRTLSAFKDIVAQLREQLPDEVFLDKLAERFLTDSED